jgi:hypothetical protein
MSASFEAKLKLISSIFKMVFTTRVRKVQHVESRPCGVQMD